MSLPQIDACHRNSAPPRRQRTRIVCRYGLNAALAFATGCGGELAVRGHVTANGKPVHSGTITFQRTDGKGSAVGSAVQQGAFDLGKQNSLKAGEYQATLEGFQTTGRMINDYQRGSIPETVPLTLAEKAQAVQISKSNAGQLTLDFHTRNSK